MPTPAQEAAAQFLLAARRSRTPGPRLPEDLRPADTEAGLAIQARVAGLAGQPIGGWKCSAPTEPRPVALAPIFAPAIRRASPCPLLPMHGQARIEPEIAFVMGRDLPQRATPYGEDEVRAAIGEVRFVLELIGSRYADPAAATFPELLADSISNEGLFIGPVVPGGLANALEAFPITVRSGGATLATREGKHPDGHPFKPLLWLANYLAGTRGLPLRAGDVVTTGSYCGVLDVPYDTPLTFGYGNLGTLDVRFERAA
ncbi:MAG: fumarylacetoacetate hydrolase family protein [Burkholderiales bacterium]